MKVSTMREKIFAEIAKIPDEKVPEVYDLLLRFRIRLGDKKSNPQKILQLAGSWNDMSEKDFADFLNDVATRRKNAFILRSNREKSFD